MDHRSIAFMINRPLAFPSIIAHHKHRQRSMQRTTANANKAKPRWTNAICANIACTCMHIWIYCVSINVSQETASEQICFAAYERERTKPFIMLAVRSGDWSLLEGTQLISTPLQCGNDAYRQQNIYDVTTKCISIVVEQVASTITINHPRRGSDVAIISSRIACLCSSLASRPLEISFCCCIARSAISGKRFYCRKHGVQVFSRSGITWAWLNTFPRTTRMNFDRSPHVHYNDFDELQTKLHKLYFVAINSMTYRIRRGNPLNDEIKFCVWGEYGEREREREKCQHIWGDDSGNLPLRNLSPLFVLMANRPMVRLFLTLCILRSLTSVRNFESPVSRLFIPHCFICCVSLPFCL